MPIGIGRVGDEPVVRYAVRARAGPPRLYLPKRTSPPTKRRRWDPVGAALVGRTSERRGTGMCRRDHASLLRTSPRATALALLAVPSTRTVLAAPSGAFDDGIDVDASPCRRCRLTAAGGTAVTVRCSSLIDEAGEVIGDDSELFVTLLLDTEHVGRPVRAMATVGTAQPRTSAHPTPPRSGLVGRHQSYDQPKVTTCRKLPLQRTTPSKAPHRCRSVLAAVAVRRRSVARSVRRRRTCEQCDGAGPLGLADRRNLGVELAGVQLSGRCVLIRSCWFTHGH
jgi:hypothetical protein